MTLMEVDPRNTKRYPTHLYEAAAKYREFSDDELQDEWKRLIGLSRDNIMAMAVVLSEMVVRGQDVSHIRCNYPERYNYLMKVADGRILPRIVERFSGSPGMLGKIGSLPMSRQAEIAEANVVDVAVRDQSGGFTIRKMQLSSLPKPLVSQVFSSTGERTFEQQIAFVEGRVATPKQAKRKQVKIDHRAGLVRVLGACVLAVSDLENYLQELKRGR